MDVGWRSKSKSDWYGYWYSMGIEKIINGDGDGEYKILPDSDSLPSLT